MISNLLAQLVNKLNSNGIPYCNWKSSISLTKALSGERDLDLFVERKSLSKVEAILRNLEFKPAVPIWSQETPGEYHYYGFDPQLDRLVHVHLFNQVLTGESYVKSHLFPFESMLLENTYPVGHVRVISKPAELLLFVLRIFVKYGSLLDLIHLIKRGEDIKSEAHWLQTDVDISDALHLLKKHCPVMDEKLFIKCIDILNTNSSLVERISLARRVRRHLRIYAKYNVVSRFFAYIQLLWGQVQRRLRRNKRNKMLHSGGVVIAFVGPDAVGKSTLVGECGRWLDKVFEVRIVHAGRPPSSCLTAPVNIVLRLTRKFLIRFRDHCLDGRGSQTEPSQSQLKGLYSLMYALRALSLAWDRRQLLIKARRLAANGKIIICDRYPSDVIGAMDSRRLQDNSVNGRPIAAIYNWMARLEEQIYKQIPPPDIAISLTVSLETAKRRNHERIKTRKGQDAELEFRHRQSSNWHVSGTKCIYDINTEQSLSETFLSAQRVIWEWL